MIDIRLNMNDSAILAHQSNKNEQQKFKKIPKKLSTNLLLFSDGHAFCKKSFNALVNSRKHCKWLSVTEKGSGFDDSVDQPKYDKGNQRNCQLYTKLFLTLLSFVLSCGKTQFQWSNPCKITVFCPWHPVRKDRSGRDSLLWQKSFAFSRVTETVEGCLLKHTCSTLLRSEKP